ncbi:MAG: O-antigen ligase family protein [Candidatus Tectomicrobia bacterium]|nr:O-antigen ligase family protein [Candidatus Tectomicrobia bacterium]
MRLKLKGYFPGTLLLLAALFIGSMGAINPAALGAGVMILGLVFACAFLMLQPQKALMLSFFLVILANTKFRLRDAGALLTGDIDDQIIFELALYGAILLITLINLRSIPRRHLKPSSTELVLFGYVVLALASSLWSYEFRITAVRGMQLSILYALCFVAVRVLGPQEVLRMIAVSVIPYVLLCSLMAFMFPWASGTVFTHGTRLERFSWFSVHPILAATYTATAVIFITSEAFFAQGSWRRRIMGLPLWLYLIPLGFILIATRSRGPLLAFVAAVSMLWVIRYVSPWIAGFTGYAVITLSAISLSAGFYSPSEAVEDLIGSGNPLIAFLLRGQTSDSLLSLSGRTELWQNAYGLFLERPILGYGYIASRSVLLGVIPWAGHAHNAFIETLLDLGVIGTALLWFALGKTLLSSLGQASRTADRAVWHQASILGVLLFLLFNSSIDATFAGAPGYQLLLLFASIFAYEGLKLTARSLSGDPEVFMSHLGLSQLLLAMWRR